MSGVFSMQRYEVNMPGTGICSFCKSPIISEEDIQNFDIIVFGIPYDWGVGFRPGARFGPRAIREMSTRFALDGRGYWDIEKKKRMLSGVQIGDIGDADILYYENEHNFMVYKQFLLGSINSSPDIFILYITWHNVLFSKDI